MSDVKCQLSISMMLTTVMQVILFDHVGPFLSYHYRWCICIAADNIRHNAGIDDTQPAHSMHPQSRIDHSRFIFSRSHFACARWMIDCLRVMLCHTAEEIVAEEDETAAARYNSWIECGIHRLENTGLTHFISEFGAFNLVENKGKLILGS